MDIRKKLNVINARAAGSSKLPADKKRAPLFFLSIHPISNYYFLFLRGKKNRSAVHLFWRFFFFFFFFFRFLRRPARNFLFLRSSVVCMLNEKWWKIKRNEEIYLLIAILSAALLPLSSPVVTLCYYSIV